MKFFFYAGERRGSIAPPVFSGKCYVQLCPPTSTSPELQPINERRDEPDLNTREVKPPAIRKGRSVVRAPSLPAFRRFAILSGQLLKLRLSVLGLKSSS